VNSKQPTLCFIIVIICFGAKASNSLCQKMNQKTYEQIVHFLSVQQVDPSRWSSDMVMMPYKQRKSQKAHFRTKVKKFQLNGGDLFQKVEVDGEEKYLRVIPERELKNFSEEEHGAHHLSAKLMLKNMRQRVYWRNRNRLMDRNVKEFVAHCSTCLRRKRKPERQVADDPDSLPSLQIGMKVWVQDPKGSGRELPAKVSRIKADGTFLLLWGTQGGFEPTDRKNGPSSRPYRREELRNEASCESEKKDQDEEKGEEEEEEQEEEQEQEQEKEEEQTWADIDAINNGIIPLMAILESRKQLEQLEEKERKKGKQRGRTKSYAKRRKINKEKEKREQQETEKEKEPAPKKLALRVRGAPKMSASKQFELAIQQGQEAAKRRVRQRKPK
jgi:hypothetical protein